MLTRRRKWLLGGGAGALVAGFVLIGSAAVNAEPSTDWSLNSSQVAQARQALMLMSTHSDPSSTGKSARVTGAWPANIQTGRAFGTDRAAANRAMGEPNAAPASDTRPVVCAEAHGHFSTVGSPRPQGSPAQTYTYAVICFDPTSGDVLDSGFDNKPVTGTFNSSRAIDVSSAITSTVK